MSSPYVGEIRLFGGNFAPAGWMTCDGQLLAISDYDTLFNLIGTTYGGDGQSTFALPNLAARSPVHMGSNGTNSYVIGSNGGVTSVTLNTTQIPSHNHPVNAVAGNQQTSPSGAYLAPTTVSQAQPYGAGTAPTALNGSSIGFTGGGQPHDNMQPYLAITYIISLYGVYPSPN